MTRGLRAALFAVCVTVLCGMPFAAQQAPSTAPWMQMTLVQVAPANLDDYIAAQRDIANRLRRGTGAAAPSGSNYRIVSRSEFGNTSRFVIATPAQTLATFDDAARNIDAELALLNSKALRYVTGQQNLAIRNLPEIDNRMPANQQPALMVISLVHVAPGREQDYYNVLKGDFFPHFDKAAVFHTTGNIVFGGESGFVHQYFYNNYAALDAGSPVVKALGAAGAQAVTAKLAGIVTSSEQWITRVVPELSFGGWPASAAALDAGDRAQVDEAIAVLLKSEQGLKAIHGGDAETSRQIASLLETALNFHSTHGDTDCPVCGKKAGLSKSWAESSRKEVSRLRQIAGESTEAHRAAEDAIRRARALIVAPPRFLSQLPELEGLAEARKQWDIWYAGVAGNDLLVLANHLETTHQVFSEAIEKLRTSAQAELKRREDRWRPIATGLTDWTKAARNAQQAAACIPRLKRAEAWLKEASGGIRDDRFAPIADRAMATWEHLRQQSNVTLGRIELTGAKSSRRVSLDVTVDGIPGAALGVMSQGELHSLALSLFLPRATLSSSPFRFVVIDDPVQSMDPSRIDGLARALEETARTRQVIVFTHDERLPEAVRRLAIKSTVFSVTRRPKSVVEIRPALDPVQAYIEDARALFHTSDLPDKVVRRLVPGFCRSALEAAFITVIRRRRLAAGRRHDEVEEELQTASKLNPLAALALFDDMTRSSDVMSRLNQWGPWAGDVFRQCKDGPHVEVEGDLQFMIKSAEKLAAHALELK